VSDLKDGNGQNGNGNVITLKLRGKNPGRFAHTIYQEDLEKLLFRRRQVREAKKELSEIAKYIGTALRTGARVEDGVHIAELVPVGRGASHAEPCSYYRLSVS
jgi:hypothetical protein